MINMKNIRNIINILADEKTFVFAVNERIAIRNALELYRNELTNKLLNCEADSTEYYDIELEETDEILEKLGPQE